MSETEELFKAVQLDQNAAESTKPEPEIPQPCLSGADPASTQTPETGEGTPAPASTEAAQGGRWTSAVEQFKLKRFFVLRPGTLDHAIEDIKAVVNPKDDGAVESIWLMAEIDHWNNEKERLVLITENSLLICKYDFIMLNCEQIQRVPLNFVDRITHGTFSFPPRSLLKREGEGVRVFWDRLREPSFTSRWNPLAVDYPYTTLTYHPVRNINDKLARMCEIHTFREQLTAAAQKAHARNPVPGKANGVLVLNQPILIEAYVGLMSVIGNQNKLGYCLARGNIGF
ncbi:tumor protein p63-regulated gene 1 protein [Pygocentrus nattereri]|uniref:HSac2 domain-containing protein n=1 Tax=Pygocentrus nattereri TaxID=42514 RepID=A0A3B4EMW0_PYGNA|nr:tumor protein p63-regulated gene 1 protein [Pygocentrus nattereri]XP_037390682.1 tumor protein p63-regulated gene 1 protein [Pygocentrus nattereri]